MTDTSQTLWPPLPYRQWEPTKQTLHRYAQILGKIRMSLVPFRNHWWHVTLLPATRGLTTGPMPYDGRDVEILLDLLGHRLLVTTSDGQRRGLDLRQRPSCADVYVDLFAALHEVGVDVAINPQPFDLGDSPSFPDDRLHDAYDAEAVARFWRVLASTAHVLGDFASRFNGKASPVQLFWHSFDLAYARYSGRQSPVPATADPVTAEAYSHEVIAFGFWPGDDRRTPYPAFYSYTAAEPDGLALRPLEPEQAEWMDTGSGHLAVLPYGALRAATDSHRQLLDFFESAYQAGAGSAAWDTTAFSTRRAGAHRSGSD